MLSPSVLLTIHSLLQLLDQGSDNACSVLFSFHGVVVELPQKHEDDLRSVKAVHGRRRVSYSWCMFVISNAYGGLSGGRDECGG